MSGPTPAVLPEREPFVDELRALALLGIALVNVPWFGVSSQGWTDAALAAPADRAAAWLACAVAQGKFYLLFSFLFGYSLRFQDAGAGGRSRIRRRLAGLGVLGALHGMLLFEGDILLPYALLALMAVRLRRGSDSRLRRGALVAALLWMAALALVAFLPVGGDAGLHAFRFFDQLRATGPWPQVVAARAIGLWPPALMATLVTLGGGVVAAFCLGELASRRALLAEPDRSAPLWRRGIRIGLAAGVPLAVLGAWLYLGAGAPQDRPTSRTMHGLALVTFAAPLLTWAYLGLAWQARARWPGVFARLRPLGRMSLTAYLAQSVLFTLVFAVWGRDSAGGLGAALVLAVPFGIWALLLLAATWWMRSHRRGPVEAALARWTRAGA